MNEMVGEAGLDKRLARCPWILVKVPLITDLDHGGLDIVHPQSLIPRVGSVWHVAVAQMQDPVILGTPPDRVHLVDPVDKVLTDAATTYAGIMFMEPFAKRQLHHPSPIGTSEHLLHPAGVGLDGIECPKCLDLSLLPSTCLT
jgi:hypothetical protein